MKIDWPDPNTVPDDEAGFWICFQFDNDGSSDPNDHWFKGAVWNGGRNDWDGQWIMELPLVNDNWDDPNDPNLPLAKYTNGIGGLAVAGTVDIGLTVDVATDNAECRWGVYTNVSRALDLTVKTVSKGTVTIDPDILEDDQGDPNDPNQPDPNDPNEVRRYTDGTEIVLVATPVTGKSFKQWKIYDPNHPGDSSYVSVDTNAVLYLTMDGDYQIEAIFKCGSSEMLPPVGMVMFVLAMGCVFRRFR
jgi:hypothetical protein